MDDARPDQDTASKQTPPERAEVRSAIDDSEVVFNPEIEGGVLSPLTGGFLKDFALFFLIFLALAVSIPAAVDAWRDAKGFEPAKLVGGSFGSSPPVPASPGMAHGRFKPAATIAAGKVFRVDSPQPRLRLDSDGSGTGGFNDGLGPGGSTDPWGRLYRIDTHKGIMTSPGEDGAFGTADDIVKPYRE